MIWPQITFAISFLPFLGTLMKLTWLFDSPESYLNTIVQAFP